MRFQSAKWLIAVILSIIMGVVLSSAIMSVLMGCSEFGDDDDDVPAPSDSGVHFTFTYADDIKSDPMFDTEAERDAYKKQALDELGDLFDDFDKRFGFKPDHSIEIILSKTVSFHGWKDVKNIAFTHEDYENGKVTNLSIHFPYEMFRKKWVRGHELTHAFLAEFHFPHWLGEGLAVYNENMYTDTPTHPVFVNITGNIRTDGDGINATQHWTEGQGIYEDMELTTWCYRFAHTIVNYLETTSPGTIAHLLETVEPYKKHSTKELVDVLGHKDFFKSIKFDF